MAEQEQQQPTVFCAWCRRVIAWGEHGIAHGICETCVPTVAAEIEARLKGDDRRGRLRPQAEPGTN
ncbi:MAG: hypothetical protein ACM3S1_16570, partial [Hyphomicrobiales bacterium]